MKKNIYIFFSILVFIVLTGCDDPVIYHYTLENQSGVPITLKPFFYDNTGRDIPNEKIIILNNDY